ncbi:MAG: aminotransferase class I/II-fold pyridoxal phosphate-dependent enzyme [Oscillospiraceae bacterium]|nr:aminotransferase class I/II-fold pyridoxal phosphate-dependent enzyme [Oscillospiraceae bacterium]
MQDPHGGNIYTHSVKLDLSANINPLGTPDSVIRAVTASAGQWAHYPDPSCRVLSVALSEREGYPAEHIVCGSGADDLLFRIAYAFRPKTALLAEPCFGEYRRALEASGCRVLSHRGQKPAFFALSEAIFSEIEKKPDMLLLCTPNNPTGQLIPPDLLDAIARKCESMGILFVLDICFLSMTKAHAQSLPRTAILVNAFTKSHAIPGLRIGYALCPDAQTAQRIREQGQFWSVSAPAQAAGLAALQEDAYLAEARTLIAEERQYLAKNLQEMGCIVCPSDANFLLFQSEPGLADRLLEQGILIRSCANFAELDDTWYRIAVRTRPENQTLLQALRRDMGCGA